MPAAEWRAARRRWLRAGCAGGPLLALGLPLRASGPPLRFAPERNYGPFVYEQSPGEIRGLSIDMLALVLKYAGLSITMLPARPLHEQLAAARRGEVDLLSSLRPTTERGEYLLFTRPYVAVPALLYVRRGERQRTLAQLRGQSVALGRGYAVAAWGAATHPEVRWATVDDDVHALRGLAEGRYRGAVVDAASAPFVMRREGLAGIEPAGQVGFDYRLSFAVPVGREALRDRLDHGIQAISAAERQAVLDRWLDVAGTPWRVPGWAAAAVATTSVVSAALLVGLAVRRRRGTP